MDNSTRKIIEAEGWVRRWRTAMDTVTFHLLRFGENRTKEEIMREIKKIRQIEVENKSEDHRPTEIKEAERVMKESKAEGRKGERC